MFHVFPLCFYQPNPIIIIVCISYTAIAAGEGWMLVSVRLIWFRPFIHLSLITEDKRRLLLGLHVSLFTYFIIINPGIGNPGKTYTCSLYSFPQKWVGWLKMRIIRKTNEPGADGSQVPGSLSLGVAEGLPMHHPNLQYTQIQIID
jgi:hypothetical protein